MTTKKTMNRFLFSLGLSLTLSSAGHSAAVSTPSIADSIFTGGPVITMNDRQSQAAAVAVRDGKIIYVGSAEGVEGFRGNQTRHIDLQGRTLLPGFIDSHSHIAIDALLYDFADVTPAPAGPINSIEDIKAVLQQQKPNQGWLLAYGYDQTRLKEQRHPTRFDLDKVSTEVPILLVHVSMHLFVANSKALEMAGIDANSVDPDGGKYLRIAGSQEPNGVIEELAAAGPVVAIAPIPGAEQFTQNLIQLQHKYASHGITTANEGAATFEQLSLLDYASKNSHFPIDLTALSSWHSVDAMLESGKFTVGKYQNRLKVAGVKFGVDGSLLGSTAFLLSPYTQAPAGKAAHYRGYTQLSKKHINQIVEDNYQRKIQLYGHVAGDAAADLFLQAIDNAVKKYGSRDHRSVMIHALMLNEPQIQEVKHQNILPSFYAYHPCYWGDWYQDTSLGLERGAKVSPAKSAAKIGLKYTLHSDAPITPIDQIELLDCSVNRTTQSDTVIGPDQRLSPLEALKGLTSHAAYQYFEEDRKGTIEAGKLADLVILSTNPLETGADKIKGIRVIETFKEGRSVYRCANQCQDKY